jgi:hypothetical protein
MFAIGYGIPPNGPLRAIRVNATPLAREVAAYLNRIGPGQQCFDGSEVQSMTAPVKSMGAR